MNTSVLLLLFAIALVDAYQAPEQVKYLRKTIMMKNRGMISPNEVADYLNYLPHTIDDMDFSRCEADTIQQIKKHLNEKGKEAFEKKLAAPVKHNPLRHTTDGICSTVPPPRMTTGSIYDVDVDGVWKHPSYSVTPMVGTAQMAFFEDGTPNDDDNTASSEDSSSEWRHPAENGDDEVEEDFAETRKKRLEEARRRMAQFSQQPKQTPKIDSDSEEDEAEVLRQFMRGPTQNQRTVQNHRAVQNQRTAESPKTVETSKPIGEPVWAPPSKPRRPAFHGKKADNSNGTPSTSLRRRPSSSELIDAGYQNFGNDRYSSPTRSKPEHRKALSRENSFGSGRLSQAVLLRTQKFSTSSQKYRGIRNGDNLCYIIAVVQALFHIPAVTNAMLILEPTEAKLHKRPALMALWRLFDNLGKFVDRPTDMKELGPALEAVELDKTDIKLLSVKHDGQGDASEVFQHILSIAGSAIKSWLQETIIEDRPMGYIFKSRWESTRYIQYNVLDYDFHSLQQYIDYGVAEAIQLKLDPITDNRQACYMEAKALNQPPTVAAVKFNNIIKPGPLLCFHLVRYSTGGSSRSNRSSGQANPRLGSVQLEYQEEIKILDLTYVLQSVVVHETWPGFGNQGHYYTIARTSDEKEPWVELDDSRVSVVTKGHALSKTSTATLVIYSLKEDQEAAVSESLDLSKAKFINHDRVATNMLRTVIQESVPFSHDFHIESHRKSLHSVYESKGFSRSTVRQAFAIINVNPSEDMTTLLQSLESERMGLAKEMLLERFPDKPEEIEAALQKHNGSYQLALLDLTKTSQSL